MRDRNSHEKGNTPKNYLPSPETNKQTIRRYKWLEGQIFPFLLPCSYHTRFTLRVDPKYCMFHTDYFQGGTLILKSTRQWLLNNLVATHLLDNLTLLVAIIVVSKYYPKSQFYLHLIPSIMVKSGAKIVWNSPLGHVKEQISRKGMFWNSTISSHA